MCLPERQSMHCGWKVHESMCSMSHADGMRLAGVVGKNSPVLYIIVAYVCVCANVWVMCGCKGGTLTVVARACVFMADQCTLLFMGW